MDVLGDIKALLTSITTDINAELIADKDNCIAIVVSGGLPTEHMFGAQKPAIVHPSFQITVRHTNGSTINTWWDSIKTALDGKVNYTPTGTSRTYIFIEQQGEVLSLGRDQNRRHIQVLNFITSIINAY